MDFEKIETKTGGEKDVVNDQQTESTDCGIQPKNIKQKLSDL